MDQLDVSAERREGHVVVRLAGPLDADTAPAARIAILDALGESRNVVLDCAELDFLDSAGLGVLVAARTRVRAAGGTMVLSGVRPPLELLLDATGVGRLFRLDPRPPAVATG